MTLEEREEIRAKAWRDVGPEVATEMVALFLAFFSRESIYDPETVLGILIHRGLSVTEASAIISRVARLLGEK